ncbi:hypothetical protein [Streptomyces sp. NPDC088785]|uniref:hypothetical protein n=1 Tax=Streptomyces sp. NPDC088785 TaxID=3365897 RepID=UPI003822143C
MSMSPRTERRTGRRSARGIAVKVLVFLLVWAFLCALMWLRTGGPSPGIVLLSFVLALLVFTSNLRELRQERTRRTSLEAGEHELSRYAVHGAAEGRSRLFRTARLLRTTDRAVEMWRGPDRQWRHPWRDLTFTDGRDGHGEILSVEAAGGSPESLRLGPGATVYEILAAARHQGARVRERAGDGTRGLRGDGRPES